MCSSEHVHADVRCKLHPISCTSRGQPPAYCQAIWVAFCEATWQRQLIGCSMEPWPDPWGPWQKLSAHGLCAPLPWVHTGPCRLLDPGYDLRPYANSCQPLRLRALPMQAHAEPYSPTDPSCDSPGLLRCKACLIGTVSPLPHAHAN